MVLPYQEFFSEVKSEYNRLLADFEGKTGVGVLHAQRLSSMPVHPKPNSTEAYDALIKFTGDQKLLRHAMYKVAIRRVSNKRPDLVPYVENSALYKETHEDIAKGYGPEKQVLKLSYEVRDDQAKLAKLAPEVTVKPAPKSKLKNLLQNTETLSATAAVVAFSLLFVYLKNPPGTVGYASLPNYGVTTIFLSIVILAALLYLFRKTR